MNSNSVYYIPHQTTIQKANEFIKPVIENTRPEGVKYINTNEQSYADRNAFFNNYKSSEYVERNEVINIMRRQSAMQEHIKKKNSINQDKDSTQLEQQKLVKTYYINIFFRIIKNTFAYIYIMIKNIYLQTLYLLKNLFPDTTTWSWEDRTSLLLATIIVVVFILYISSNILNITSIYTEVNSGIFRKL